MNRFEHLEWCKQRALEYVDSGDLANAVSSMISDLGKHSGTQGHSGIGLLNQSFLTGHLSSPQKMRNFIEGFN